jgi:hypothetical protein
MYDELKSALLSVGVPVFHFEAEKTPAPYIVWAEDGTADTFRSDNHISEMLVSGTVTYFTNIEYDPNAQKIQRVLGDVCMTWDLIDIDYGDFVNSTSAQSARATGERIVRYTWSFSVIPNMEVGDGEFQG